jgi:hypothetical protein
MVEEEYCSSRAVNSGEGRHKDKVMLILSGMRGRDVGVWGFEKRWVTSLPTDRACFEQMVSCTAEMMSPKYGSNRTDHLKG